MNCRAISCRPDGTWTLFAICPLRLGAPFFAIFAKGGGRTAQENWRRSKLSWSAQSLGMNLACVQPGRLGLGIGGDRSECHG